MKNNNYSSILQSFFFYVLIFVTICFLFFKINIELKQEINPSTSFAIQKEKNFFHYLKTYSNIGYFNLDNNLESKIREDFAFIIFQYIIAPTILEKDTYNKIIICYYTFPSQLTIFCQKNKKFRLIRKNIHNNFALLERIN